MRVNFIESTPRSRFGDVWSNDGREHMHMVGCTLLPWWARHWMRHWSETPIVQVRFRPHPQGTKRGFTEYWNGGTLTVLWPSVRGGPYLERSVEVPAGRHYQAWLIEQRT